jgi:hypothetical protein
LEVHIKFRPKNLNGRGYSEDLGVDGKIVLVEGILGKWGGKMADWIHLVQDRGQWRLL